MDSGALLQEIATYCRSVGLAESTFGRLAINDGKLVNRLRYGGRITTDTLERIRSFMAANPRNRHVDAEEQGYFEGGGGYRVAVIIEPDLTVTVSSELEKY